MDDSEKILHEIPKKPRKPYTRKTISEIPAPVSVPQAPNPNISAMESKIGELVEQRSAAQFQIHRANQNFQAAQNLLQAAKDEFSRIEGEISYRMALINQMRGGVPALAPQPPLMYGGIPVRVDPNLRGGEFYFEHPPQSPMASPYAPPQGYPQYPPTFDPRLVPPVGVGSAPAPNYGLYPDVGGGPDGARTESAEAIRSQEMHVRGY